MVLDSWVIVDDFSAFLVLSNLAESKAEAKRLIKQNAVRIDGTTYVEGTEVELRHGTVVNVGRRRWLKCTLPPVDPVEVLLCTPPPFDPWTVEVVG